MLWHWNRVLTLWELIGNKQKRNTVAPADSVQSVYSLFPCACIRYTSAFKCTHMCCSHAAIWSCTFIFLYILCVLPFLDQESFGSLERSPHPQLVHLLGAAVSLVSTGLPYQFNPSPQHSTHGSKVRSKAAAGYQMRIHCNQKLFLHIWIKYKISKKLHVTKVASC